MTPNELAQAEADIKNLTKEYKEACSSILEDLPKKAGALREAIRQMKNQTMTKEFQER